jgi:hypothetical protein
MVNARIRPLVAVASLIGSVAVLAAACSSTATSTAAASGTATHASAASASPSTPNPAAEALAAYQAMWVDVAKAITTDDYQAPYLSDHLSGQGLQTITNNMTADKKQGIVGRGAPVLHPVVTSTTTMTVAISDCLDDRGWLQYNASTGKLLDTVPGGFRATTATVTDQNGIWKVAQINTGADGTCHLSSPTG